MAGTIVVSALVKTLFDKVGSPLLNEFSLLLGAEKHLKALKSTISTVKDVLEDADECYITDKQVYNWLRKLKEIVYDADDLLDELYLEAQMHKDESRGNILPRLNLVKRLKLAHKIRSINRKLDAIAGERKFHLGSKAVKYSEIDIKYRETWSMIDEGVMKICGREHEKMEILSRLRQNDGNENISVISIVGLGGLGKTTLAQLAYKNENELKGYFDLRMWVYVSPNFEFKRIVQELIESAIKTKWDDQNLNSLGEKLQCELKGKRFFLVLDDVWNENYQEWEKLKSILNVGAFGSKIIVTTRSMRVSQIMNATSPFNLEGLPEAISWDLFKKSAFGGSETIADSRILEIAHEIMKKCAGVPLALKALGSIMQLKESIEEWEEVRDNNIWELESEDQVIKSLKLSYMHMPSFLKGCFTYCSIFLKGQVIRKLDLIGQWIAHGLVGSPRSKGISEEDKANQYFKHLVQMSFLQIVDEKSNGEVKCKMHDLVHDLSRSIVANDLSIMKDMDVATNINVGCRYMSLIDCSGKVEPTIVKKVRALHIHGGNLFVANMDDKAKSLRSLILDRVGFDTLPFFSPKLILLRHIFISSSSFTTIPDDICCLRSLQALHLQCRNITNLPDSIGRLVGLRTLEVVGGKLKSLPGSIDLCQSLRNLIVEDNPLENIPNSFGNLRNLERLVLSNCNRFKSLPESIGNLHNLRYIFISSSSFTTIPDDTCCLRSLQALHLQCHNITNLPDSIGRLVGLRTLEVVGGKLESLPGSIGLCQSLLNLIVEDNPLESIPNSFGNLRNLERLVLSNCNRLKSLPEPIGNLHNLHVLNLEGSSNVVTLPASICKLVNLITLNIEDTALTELPKFGEMKKLRNFCTNHRLLGMPIGIGKSTLLPRLGTFPINIESKYACVSELEDLNFLSGNLRIYGLEKLDNKRKAAQANLKKKQNLESLYLRWNSMSEAYLISEAEAVLEALQPPSSINSLKIEGYPGVEYPNWMMFGETNTSSFPYLTSMTLYCLKRSYRLPRLVELPHLRYLHLNKIDSLTIISGYFPSLVELHLHNMVNMKELTTMNLVICDEPETMNAYEPAFPRLSELFISDCPKLTIQPHLPPSVVLLKLSGRTEKLLGGEEFSDDKATSQVSSSSFKLQKISITEMRLLWDNHFLRQLGSLRELEFYRSMLISSLPEIIRQLSSLQVLLISGERYFSGFPEWLGELKSLKKLTIIDTPLISLPKSIQHLTALQLLSYGGCTPSFHKSYERVKGKDWTLISHIPEVIVLWGPEPQKSCCRNPLSRVSARQQTSTTRLRYPHQTPRISQYAFASRPPSLLASHSSRPSRF